MANKEQGWSAARLSAVRFLALTLSVSTVALALTTHTAYAVDQKKARDKIVDLNKQALLSYEAKDFETAKSLLTKALKEAKEAGLDDDKMTARTYLHLGAVYWVGFQDQAVALQNFTLAKKIRPDIQLTPSIETADLKSVFDLAVVEAEPAPAPASPPPPVRAQPQPRPATPRLSGDEGGEPDLPATMSSPLMCTVPDAVPPGRELSIRCALKPGLNAKVVQLHHRAPGVEAYQVLPMHKTAKGWYLATLPGHVMKPGDLQIYFDARDANDKEIASNGQVDSPSIVEIRKKGGGPRGGGDEEDPLNRIRSQQRDEAYEAGLHRRREGAFWVGVGGGVGWGFAPAGDLEWEKTSSGNPIKVSAISTTTGLFHLLPELGYMWSDSFGVALQARVEFIQQQQGYYQDQNGGIQLTPSHHDGSPTTKAFAAFARAIWYTDLISSGNLQFSLSGDLGGGFVRFPLKPTVSFNDPRFTDSGPNINWDNTIEKTDTRAVGPVLVGSTVGFILHVSRYFALTLDGRVLTGLPNAGAVFEGAFSTQFSLFGKAGPTPAGDDEGEGEGEGGGPGPGNDAPAPDESSSDEGE